jgi:DUF1680 family protein
MDINVLERRKFIELAALSSAGLLVGLEIAEGAPKSRKRTLRRARFAAFHSLAPGDVSPEGWLRLYLRKQAQQLGGNLPKVSWPFTVNYWAGEEKTPAIEAWWPWEQKAYWIDGALRCALILQDTQLLGKALAAIDYTLDHIHPDGYLGPTFAKDANPKMENLRWPHAIFFRALAAHAETTKDARVAACIRRHYLAEGSRASYGGPSRDVTNIESMVWAYEQTGDRQLLTMAEKAWSDFLQSAPPGDRDSGDLHPDRVFANAPITAHGVTYSEKAKLPAILYMHTGNPEYLRFALAAQDRVFNHHMLIDGVPSSTEDFRGTSPLDAHETCDITDHTWGWGYLLMATGDGRWADYIERACFNAGFGSIKKDWTGTQYFSSPNQVIATHNSSHVSFVENSEGWMAYRPNPGHDVACCGGNVHRFFPNYIARMWMVDGRGGLAAMLYGASTVRTDVGPYHQPIEIHQETNYPFGEEIRLTFRSQKPATFPLLLRIPGWCREPRLALNGESLRLSPVQKGFIRIQREFRSGDTITLTLPMQASLRPWHNDGFAFENGPLLYALPIQEHWSSVVTPKWSTKDFPEWNAIPTSPWNYAIAAKEQEAGSEIWVERRPMTEDPWIDPPITIIASMKKIFGWDLSSHPTDANRMQTPPLPTLDTGTSAAVNKIETERIALVPYGATHLRLSVFAKVELT